MKNPIVEYIVWCIAVLLAIALLAPKAAMAEPVQGYYCVTTYAFQNGDTVIEDQGAIVLDWGNRFTIINTYTGAAIESPELTPIENGSKLYAEDGNRKFSKSFNARRFVMTVDSTAVTYDCAKDHPAVVFERSTIDLAT